MKKHPDYAGKIILFRNYEYVEVGMIMCWSKFCFILAFLSFFLGASQWYWLGSFTNVVVAVMFFSAGMTIIGFSFGFISLMSKQYFRKIIKFYENKILQQRLSSMLIV